MLIIALGFLFTPIITRIYEPEAYGAFASFNAILSIITIIIPFGLGLALVLPKSTKQFVGLARFILVSTILIAILALIFFIVNDRYHLFNIQQIDDFKFLLVIAISLAGFNQILTNWNIRAKKFRKTSVLSSFGTLINKSVTVGIGVATAGYIGGLIASHVIGLLYTSISLSAILGKKNLRVLFRTKTSIWKSVSFYREYPLYIFPSQWMNTLVSQLPILMLIPIFGANTIGQYTLCLSILNIPIQLIGHNALGPVLLQKSTELMDVGIDEVKQKYSKLFRFLIPISIIGFSICFHYSEMFFVFLFGDKWVMAGTIASIMSIMFAFQLISVPSSSIMRILRLERYSLWLASVYLIITLLAIWLGKTTNEFLNTMWFISVGTGLVRLLSTCYFVSKIHFKVGSFLNIIFQTIVVVNLFILLIDYFVRLII